MPVSRDVDGLDGDGLVFSGEGGLATGADINLVLDELVEDDGVVVKDGNFLEGHGQGVGRREAEGSGREGGKERNGEQGESVS